MERLFYSYFLPRVSHEFPCVGRRDVIRHEATGVDMLKVLEGLGWVAVEGLVRACREEPRDEAADRGAVKVVHGYGPFGE